jgi:hypothetical protein
VIYVVGKRCFRVEVIVKPFASVTRDTFHDTHLYEYFRYSKRLSDLKYLSVRSVMILVVINLLKTSRDYI